VPLFVEELTKAVVEAGADRGNASISAVPPLSLAVPATLHASLLGRLDRLGPSAKTVAQIGAAIGRDFSYELLAAAVQVAEPELQEALRRLVEAGLVFQRGVPPAAEYLFKHALVQDTAYSTLLRGPRQALHRRIAEALEQRFPDLVETRPEILAHHYGEAAIADKAIAYWHRAGKSSVAKSAVHEAVAQLRRGLSLLEGLPETLERKQLELSTDAGRERARVFERWWEFLAMPSWRSTRGVSSPRFGGLITYGPSLTELLIDLVHRVAQGFVGDSHEASVGVALLQDKIAPATETAPTNSATVTVV
jgi:predicted ATPase